MIIHIVAGGPRDQIPDLSMYQHEEITWIGVDRGLFYLLHEGIKPLKGFGDFDSVSIEELDWMKQQCPNLDLFPTEKDFTDSELALEWALQQNPSLIRLFGATGGRLDHSLSCIQLLYKGLERGHNVEIIDQQNSLTMFNSGIYIVEKSNLYKYVSFLPFTKEVKGITLEGFKYPLMNEHVSWGSTLCISNEIIKERGTFSFHDGILIMVNSKDLKK